MSTIFGPDTFTVSADTNIDQYPSSGDPDYAYVVGSGSDIIAQNTNDVAWNTVFDANVRIARVVDPNVSLSMVNQEVRCTVRDGGNARTGASLRYASTRRGYGCALNDGQINEVEIVEDNSGFTLLASADRGLNRDTTYNLAGRVVGSVGVAWLSVIIDGTNVAGVAVADTATIVASGAPGFYMTALSAAGDNRIDNYLVDDLRDTPLVAGISTTNGTTATTSATVNIPSGCEAGDTLLIIFRNTEGGTITFPNEGNASTGWIQLFEDSSDASNDTTAAAWRKCSGSEGATISVALGTSGKFAAIVYLVKTAADPTARPPEFATLTVGTNTTPDPGTVTPTGGTKNYLFIWVGGWDGEQTTPPASFPVNYQFPTGADSGTAGAVATNCRVATAHREANASSENPGTWTISAAPTGWTATVIAVHPVDAAQTEFASAQLANSGGWIGGNDI